MNAQLSSLDLHFLARELQLLVGARLQKAYQGLKERKRDLTLQFHLKKGEESGSKPLLRILLPGLVYLTEEKASYGKLPGHFAVFLRKHVGNARLVDVKQRGFERILELGLENKDGRFTLILELIPPGNALLLNKEGKIVNLLEPQKTSSRVLRGGAIYAPPPALFDTKAASAEGIVERLLSSSKDAIVKSLAIDLGLGGEYAEEACARAKIEKSRKELKKEELLRLAKSVKGLFDEELVPCVVGDGAFPFRMETKQGAVGSPSFSHAIESVIPEPEEEADAPAAIQRVKRGKAADVLKHQAAALEGFRKAAEENQRKGELLYEHYQEVKLLLDEVNARRQKHGWKGVKERMKGKILRIDEEKGEITIDLE